MTATQARRLREHRSRVLIRDFEHRQRHHARAELTSARPLAWRPDAELLATEYLVLVPFEIDQSTTGD